MTARNPRHVPTLTEVVQVEAPPPSLVGPLPENLPVEADAVDEAVLAQHVLADVQRQVDLMLEYRLREALAPALARAADALVRELRHELASVLRELVERAVEQEIARHKGR